MWSIFRPMLLVNGGSDSDKLHVRQNWPTENSTHVSRKNYTEGAVATQNLYTWRLSVQSVRALPSAEDEEGFLQNIWFKNASDVEQF